MTKAWIFFILILSFVSCLSELNTSIISPLSIHSNNNTVIVVSWDGCISLLEVDSKRIHWTYRSGIPVYSSYQAEDTDYYIDIGTDWNLYMHDKKGTSRRLRTTVRDLVINTPISVRGTTIVGHMTTSVTVLDATTGILVHSFSSTDMGFDSGKPMLLGEAVKKLEAAELVTIRRIDYALLAFSESWSPLYNFMYSDVAAEFFSGSAVSCARNLSSTTETSVRTYCQRAATVYRIHGGDHSARLSLGYSAQYTDMQLSAPVVREELLGLTPFESTAIAIPESGIVNGDSSWVSFMPTIVIFCFITLIGLFVLCYCFPASSLVDRLKSSGESRDIASNPVKNMSSDLGMPMDRLESSGENKSEDSPVKKKKKKKKKKNTKRKISYNKYNVIGEGSNGTMVFEGDVDGRPVAVKRLVKTAYPDLGNKEINNLMELDWHPNVTTYYAREVDDDFVYMAIELCRSNLAVYISEPEPEQSAQLWRVNGYPSIQLIKLMHDIVVGLAHLHRHKFVHRDLKPQNVLISKESSPSAMLSDMGLSKMIGDRNAQHTSGVGSSGWRAPELLRYGIQTEAMDLFSLGCVLFFCITGGHHPFGEDIERDSNIQKNKKNLSLVEGIPEACDLIHKLLHPKPDFRPSADVAKSHPMFWNSEKRLSFFRDISDRLKFEEEGNSDLLNAVELVAGQVFNGRWDANLDQDFLNDINIRRSYHYGKVQDLLRVIRNKVNHYWESSIDIQQLIGSFPNGLDDYFTSRYPKLLIQVYNAISTFCKEEEWMRQYLQ